MKKGKNKMNTDKGILVILLLALLFCCIDPYEDQITPAYEYYPAATYMSLDSANFSYWVALLKYTDLYNTMNLSANYTCFVPGNQAMEKFLSEKGYSGVGDIPFESAIHLVKYHTIPGAEYSQSLFDNGVLADTTATGDFLSIEIREGGLNALYVNGEARIEQLDLDVTNGIIHVLDKVLTPITETLWEKINTSDYSIFKQAVESSGYNEMLNTISATETNPVTGIETIRKKYFTLFAVSDAQYAEYGINSLSGLEAYLLEHTPDAGTASDELIRYIGYHILSQQIDFDALATFSGTSTSKNLETLAPNELINVSVEGENLYLNLDTALATFTSIIEENISCKNGIIHGLSAPLTVVTPPVTKVTWELTDYSDLASLFSNIYRKSTVSGTTGEYIAPGEVTCYEWDAIPSSNNDHAVAYVVANKNDAVLFEMINYDCLYLDLGLYGWIDMVSLAVIKGTYSVIIRYYSIASAVEAGKLLMILDGNYFGSEIATHGRSDTKTQNVIDTLGVVTFDETSTHHLRILAGDDTGLYLDYIEFEPKIIVEPEPEEEPGGEVTE
ncbi:MAG: fasciclin domain-containing protein [Prolixibacteraceae bacterium]|nr:fasciclin domain-containing protein [Prolixibacteraceae bacterium]